MYTQFISNLGTWTNLFVGIMNDKILIVGIMNFKYFRGKIIYHLLSCLYSIYSCLLKYDKQAVYSFLVYLYISIILCISFYHLMIIS